MTKPQDKVVKICSVCGKSAPMRKAQTKCSQKCVAKYCADYNKQWKAKNHNKVLENSRRRRANNIEAQRAYDRAYKAMCYERPSFRKKIIRRVKRYRDLNPETTRECVQISRQKHPEQSAMSSRVSSRLRYHKAVNIVLKKDLKVYVRLCSLGYYYEVYKQLHLPRIYRSEPFKTFDEAKQDALFAFD